MRLPTLLLGAALLARDPGATAGRDSEDDSGRPDDTASEDDDAADQEHFQKVLEQHCPTQWGACQASPRCADEFERTLDEEDPPQSENAELMALVACTWSLKDDGGPADTIALAEQHCSDELNACLGLEECVHEYQQALDDRKTPEAGSDEVMTLLGCLEVAKSQNDPKPSELTSADDDEDDIMGEGSKSEVSYKCHETCELCDVPQDEYSCISCPESYEVDDDDSDGAGRCVQTVTDGREQEERVDHPEDDGDIMGGDSHARTGGEPPLNPMRLQDSAAGPGASPLLVAASEGDVTKVQELLRLGVSNVNEENDDGYTALTIAANRGHGAVVEMLIRAGASMQDRDKSGQSPWYVMLSRASMRAHVFDID